MTLGIATFDRYIARTYVTWFAVTLTVLIGIVVLLEFIEMLRRTADREEVTVQIALMLTLLRAPQSIELVFQFAVLFGAMFTFWRLTRSNELVVARASGISAWRFLLPVMAVVLLIGVFKIGVYNPIGTAMFDRYRVLATQYIDGESRIFLLSRTGLWLRQQQDDGVAIMHAASVDPATATFHHAVVFLFDPEGAYAGRLDAARAVLEPGQWAFGDVAVRMDGTADRTAAQYTLPTTLTLSAILDSYADPRAQSVWQLPDFIATLDDTGFSSLPHRLHFQSLLAQPIMLVSMVLFAAAFTLRQSRRGGTLSMVVIGTVASFGFFILSDVSYALGLAAAAPVGLAAWAPACLTSLIGIALLLHLEDG